MATMETQWFRVEMTESTDELTGDPVTHPDLKGYESDVEGYSAVRSQIFGEAPWYPCLVRADSDTMDAMRNDLNAINAPLDKLSDEFETGAVKLNGEGLEW